MPLNYIPTLQNPLAGSNLGNVTSALKSPPITGMQSPLLKQAASAQDDSLPMGKAGSNNTLFSGLFGPSTGSSIQPNALLPYGANWNGAPTGTDATLNPLGD